MWCKSQAWIRNGRKLQCWHAVRGRDLLKDEWYISEKRTRHPDCVSTHVYYLGTWWLIRDERGSLLRRLRRAMEAVWNSATLTKWQPPLQSLSACASILGCADPNILWVSWAPHLSLFPGCPTPSAFRIPCLVLTVCNHCSFASIPLSKGSPTVHPQTWFVSSLLYVIQVLNSTCAFFVCPSNLINWKKDGTSRQLCLLLSRLQSAFFAPITQPS